ncbi:hypothetical protein MVES_002960 [Malassezia vespertilionis]|uniref:F-box domain-containing protein n=2 Tax=Malassezia vespertilionis TaxID=2020962 RepID=A0A2N1J8U5_9BASI|nr:hypothetical protein MVES_002960 [Malassezia vespertilionis]
MPVNDSSELTEESQKGMYSSTDSLHTGPLKFHGYFMMDEPEEKHGSASASGKGAKTSSPLTSRSEKLCVRHQRMADEGATARLQKSIDTLSLAEQEAVNTVWSLFSSSPHSRRALILRGILTMCCFSQLSLLSSELAMAIRIDPFSLFPREVSLRVLGYLDAFSLGRAAQVSRLWRSLADNDLLWRNMCEQHIERKCEKCGWGLPLLNERRSKGKELEGGARADLFSLAHDQEYKEAAASSGDGNLRRSVTAAANAAAIERRSRTAVRSNTGFRRNSPFDDERASPRKRSRMDLDEECKSDQCRTRPWKAVYCERLIIERNWRRGRYHVHSLRGHTDGVMCLGFRENVSQLNYPVLVTGSYDRTVRIWNLKTGEALQTLVGHARGVRCLQFDDCKLITGSMDRTLKIWNWRTGELLRTLEGHTEGIVSLNFNDSVLASGGADSNIRIWNFHTGECFPLRGHRDWVNSVQLWSSPLSKSCPKETPPMFLFSASDDGTIRLWDLQRRGCILVYRGHVGQVQSLKLVMMDYASINRLSRGTTTIPNDLDDMVDDEDNTLATSMPSKRDASMGASCSAQVSLPAQFYCHARDRSTSQEASTGESRAIPPMLAVTQERLSAAGLVPKLAPDASMDDIEDGVFDCSYNDDPEPSRRTSCKPKRPVLVSGSLDNTLKLWDVRTGHCFRTLFGHVEGVWCVDTDTLRIVSSSHDRTVKVWDRDTAQCQNTLVGHRAAVTCVALGDDKIVSGSDDGDLRVWSFVPSPFLPENQEQT